MKLLEVLDSEQGYDIQVILHENNLIEINHNGEGFSLNAVSADTLSVALTAMILEINKRQINADRSVF